MEYLNITLRVLRSAEFVGADVAALGTWLRVVGYCVDQENGGLIKGAADWDDRSWMLACGVTADDVEKAAPVLSMVGVDLVALGYPTEQEEAYRIQREAGRRGSKARWSTPLGTPSEPQKGASCVKERKGKEGKGIDTPHEGSLDFRVDLFLSCHEACSACNRMAVENLIREYTAAQFEEALKAFSTSWAGAVFPPSNPPLKEFRKYLQTAVKISEKKPAATSASDSDRPQRFEGRSANDP